MKPEVIDWENLTFSHTATRSMYVARTRQGEPWPGGEIVPFGDLRLSPAAGALNYGQGLFEGMKAYRADDGRTLLFRPERNAERAAAGCRRLSMEPVPVEIFLDAVKRVVRDNLDYIPTRAQGALYLRPLIFGSGAVLGVKAAPEFTFLVYVTPVGPYFKGGVTPIRLLVTRDYHRAPLKGGGGVKAIGNYCPGMKAAREAQAAGYAEVIYLDAAEEKYVEEVGAANFFALLGDTIVTPELTGSILPGVTRDSVLHIAADRFGLRTEERRICIDEVLEADEVFCTGTAAVISPIGWITHGDREVEYSGGKVGETTHKLYEALTTIQYGAAEDPYGWVVEV